MQEAQASQVHSQRRLRMRIQVKFKLDLTSTTTASIKPGRYVYDVIVSDSAGEVTRVVEGSVLVRQGVTR